MRLRLFFLLVGIGTGAGLMYAILHDILTYQMSPEFYTKVRFQEYGLVNSYLNAAIVAMRVTWLYSLVLSLCLTLAGSLHTDGKQFLKRTLQAFLITIITSMLFSLLGAATASTATDNLTSEKILSSIQNPQNFLVVQKIHNFSYMGGIAGMFFGLLFQIYTIRKLRK